MCTRFQIRIWFICLLLLLRMGSWARQKKQTEKFKFVLVVKIKREYSNVQARASSLHITMQSFILIMIYQPIIVNTHTDDVMDFYTQKDSIVKLIDYWCVCARVWVYEYSFSSRFHVEQCYCMRISLTHFGFDSHTAACVSLSLSMCVCISCICVWIHGHRSIACVFVCTSWLLHRFWPL